MDWLNEAYDAVKSELVEFAGQLQEVRQQGRLAFGSSDVHVIFFPGLCAILKRPRGCIFER